MTEKLYNVKCRKIEPENRDTYSAHAGEFIEHSGGEDGWDVEVGGEARYAVALDEAGVEAFREASNLLDLEEAATDEAYGAIRDGVDSDMLLMHNMRDLEAGPIKPLLMVADTGDTTAAYVRNRMLDSWTWFADTVGRNTHGPWCLGAATPPELGKFVVSAKVLGDNGSGANSNGIAALYRFARFCRDRGVPGVASLSLGSRSPSNAYRDAVAYCISQNVAVIAAAGNDSRRDGISFPGVYASSVGANDRNWKSAGFSNRNASHSLPDCYALGVNVNGIGGSKSGTSMATPGVARAVWYAMSRGMRASSVETRLRTHGSGRTLDASRLMPRMPAPPSAAGLFSHPSLREED